MRTQTVVYSRPDLQSGFFCVMRLSRSGESDCSWSTAEPVTEKTVEVGIVLKTAFQCYFGDTAVGVEKFILGSF